MGSAVATGGLPWVVNTGAACDKSGWIFLLNRKQYFLSVNVITLFSIVPCCDVITVFHTRR